MGFVDKWPLKNARVMAFSNSGGTCISFRSCLEYLDFFVKATPACIYLPKKLVGGGLVFLR